MGRFDLILKVHRRKREDRETLRKAFLEKTFKALKELRHKVPFKDAYIFGSLSKPFAFTKDSDVDVALSGLSKEHLIFAIAFLSDMLERDVDVVILEETRFKEKIKREGIRWTPDSHF